MKIEFSSSEIVKILNIPKERLREWIVRDYIKASIPAKGQGTKATFYKEDIYLIALFRDLIENGLKREVASDFIHRMFYSKYGLLTANKATIFIVRQVQIDKGEIQTETVASPEHGDTLSAFDPFQGTFYILTNDGTKLEFMYDEDTGHRLAHFSENDGWKMVLIINYQAIRREVDIKIAEK